MRDVFYVIGTDCLNASWVCLLDAYLARLSNYAVQMFPVHFTDARWKVLSCGSMISSQHRIRALYALGTTTKCIPRTRSLLRHYWRQAVILQ